MSKKLVIRGGQKILGTLDPGTGDPILTRDTSTKDVGTVPSIDPSTYLSTSLNSAQLYVGNASNLAQARTITGAVLLSNTGVTSIATDVITDANIFTGAGITYGKLNLANSIVNNDIAVAANIARTKLASGTANRILINNGSGVFSEQAAITANRLIISDANGLPIASSITTTIASYIDPTSSIQTQLDNRLLFSSAIVPVEGDLVVYQSGSWNRFARGTSGQYLSSTAGGLAWVTTPSGMPIGGTINQYLKKNSATDYDTLWDSLSISDITDISASAAQINQLTTGFYDATSSVQTQLTGKQNVALALGAIWVGNASNVAAPLTVGTNGHVLTVVAGIPTWQAVAGTGTVTSISGSGGTTGLTLTGGPITASGTLTIGGTLDADNGGTGFASYTIGDLIQANTTTTFSKLVSVATGNVLISGGVGTVSSWGKVGLTTHVSGTLPETSGGTNQTTYATGDILYASGINTLSKLAAGTNTHVLTMTGGVPTWAASSGGGGSGTVTSVSIVTANGFSGSVATASTTPAITLTLQDATTSQSGQLTSTDWNTFNGKQDVISLTTTGSSGAATFITNTLNIPNYTLVGLGGVSTTRTISTTSPLSGGGDLSANRTLSIDQATTSTDGYLSSTDWNTFSNKQSTGLSWLLASGGALTAANTISGAFNIGFTNTAIGLGVAPVSITALTKVDINGTSGGNILRLANDVNTVKYLFQNSGNLILSNTTEIDIQGSAAGITNTTGQLYLRGRNISGTRSILFGVGSAQSTDASVNWSFGQNSHSDNAAGATRSWTGLSFIQTVDQSGIGSTVNYIGIDYNPVITVTGTLNHTALRLRNGSLRLDNGAISLNGSTGTSGQVLTSQGIGLPIWQTPATGFTNPMTTLGDLIVGDTGGAAIRLGIGANTYVLTSNGTTASWQPAPGAGSGIIRSVNNISSTTTAGAAASTDYVYICTNTFTLTLPTAVGNTNVYTIKNIGTGTITVDTTSSQTIDGDLTWIIPTNIGNILNGKVLVVVSNGTNWVIIG